MQTTLFLNFYDYQNQKRRAELDFALTENIKSSAIDRIVVIDQASPKTERPTSPKITWIPTDCSKMPHNRPTFKHYFKVANEHTTSPYDLNIIANSDIFFDSSLTLLKDLDLEGICIALSRWEKNDKGAALEAWDNSQDTWIFQGPIKPLGWTEFGMGLPNCDNRLAYQLRDDDYVVLNPCLDIKTYHCHWSNIRHYPERIHGNHEHVRRCSLAECNLRSLEKRSTGIIAFSLWGNQQRYCRGAVQNAVLGKQLYPGWTLRFYYDESVPRAIIDELFELNVELVKMPASKELSGAFWRFLVADDPAYERWMVRDVDSRLNYRERRAVDEWINSNYSFHRMHDHPHHISPIMACSFGGTRGSVMHMAEKIRTWPTQGTYGDDEKFLANVVWPLVKDNCMTHSGIRKPAAVTDSDRQFPTRREYWRFVGERAYHPFESPHHGDRHVIATAFRQ